MKIRITTMIENNTHYPDDVLNQTIEASSMIAWETLLNMLKSNRDEYIRVENCELIER
jgi:hypothetical protein